MNCKKGGFVSIRHDSLRNFEANLLKKVCNGIEIEPKVWAQFKLQPVNNDEARLDIRARGFWRPGQSAFFDARLTNTNAQSQVKLPLRAFTKNMKMKRRESTTIVY